ncbi:MAG: Glycosyl transferase family 39 [Microgenomates group bacterium GW2011_GWC2_45_8]|nr:MAG: Glycosyl transferase family 39 [Microgenomates group bacterium GW2011_GWC2_45_8]KKU26226.1 MAG: Glycosyl transferase family 39 [Microgenomates group bacterium GW2011_GWA2_46_16]
MVKIILLAIFLRLFLLGSVPPSLNWDEVSQGYTAYSIAQTGRDEWGEKFPIFFRSYGEWKSAAYIYLLVPFIKVLGLNVYSVRLPSAIFGIISVYLMYLLGKKLYSEKVGLWSAFLISVTPWTFVLGRPGFEANVSLTLILAGMCFFLNSTTHHLRSIICSAILLGLAPHTYNSAKIVVPLLVIYLVWTTKLYKNLKSTLILFGILAIFAAPILLNLGSGHSLARFNQVGVATDLKSLNQFIVLRQFGTKFIFNKYNFSLYQTSANFLSYFNPSFLAVSGGDHTQHHLPYHGVLYLTELILVLHGLTTLRKYPSTLKLLPLVIIALGFLPAAMTRDPYHVLRSLLATPGFIFLAAIGISHLQQIKYPHLKIVYWLLIIEVVSFMLAYFLWYPRAFARDWQYGHQEVASYLKAHESEYDHIVMTKWYGEPQLFLAFYNRWDPRVYQEHNQPLLRYEKEGRLWLDQLSEYSLGKYTFKYLDWANEIRDSRTLYVGKPDDFYPDSNIKKTILFPDGTVAFHIVQGDK